MAVYTFELLDFERVDAMPAGRVCAWPGCDTVLNIYNPHCCCSVHHPTVELWKQDILTDHRKYTPTEKWKKDILKKEVYTSIRERGVECLQE